MGVVSGMYNLKVCAAVAVTVAAACAGCAGNPATGGPSVVLSSQGRESRIGAEMHQEMLDKGALYEDEALQAYVDKVGQRLVANSDQAGKTFTFNVVDSPDINAFALPGGYIYINRGLLAYLDNEAELAGVLGHEIGHVTARHHGRKKSAGVTSQVLAATVLILTRSGDLADATKLYGAELVTGFGRELELEADGLGAKYAYLSGYDTGAMLDVLTVLKDQQQFQIRQAKLAGKKPNTYHGLYASHPRNDERLKKVIATASELNTDVYIDDPTVPGEFKQHIDGLVWGESIQGERAENRYYHDSLRFTFEHPPGWTVAATARAIVAQAPDGSASIQLTLDRKDSASSPKKALETAASGKLSEGKSLEQAGLKGYTAIASLAGQSRRLAVIEYNNLYYLLEGEASQFATQDATLINIIESFRPSHPRERRIGQGQRIRYIQVPRGATVESIAADMEINEAETQLRLLNSLYPRGELRTGDWIKIVQ